MTRKSRSDCRSSASRHPITPLSPHTGTNVPNEGSKHEAMTKFQPNSRGRRSALSLATSTAGSSLL